MKMTLPGVGKEDGGVAVVVNMELGGGVPSVGETGNSIFAGSTSSDFGSSTFSSAVMEGLESVEVT